MDVERSEIMARLLSLAHFNHAETIQVKDHHRSKLPLEASSFAKCFAISRRAVDCEIPVYIFAARLPIPLFRQ